jgi:hypothetical protein
MTERAPKEGGSDNMSRILESCCGFPNENPPIVV